MLATLTDNTVMIYGISTAFSVQSLDSVDDVRVKLLDWEDNIVIDWISAAETPSGSGRWIASLTAGSLTAGNYYKIVAEVKATIDGLQKKATKYLEEQAVEDRPNNVV